MKASLDYFMLKKNFHYAENIVSIYKMMMMMIIMMMMID